MQVMSRLVYNHYWALSVYCYLSYRQYEKECFAKSDFECLCSYYTTYQVFSCCVEYCTYDVFYLMASYFDNVKKKG